MVVSYSSKRAKKDSADRSRLIERLLKKVKNGKVRIKDIIPNCGTKKYLSLRDKEAFIDEPKMEKNAHWDGMHGTVVPQLKVNVLIYQCFCKKSVKVRKLSYNKNEVPCLRGLCLSVSLSWDVRGKGSREYDPNRPSAHI